MGWGRGAEEEEDGREGLGVKEGKGGVGRGGHLLLAKWTGQTKKAGTAGWQ